MEIDHSFVEVTGIRIYFGTFVIQKKYALLNSTDYLLLVRNEDKFTIRIHLVTGR